VRTAIIVASALSVLSVTGAQAQDSDSGPVAQSHKFRDVVRNHSNGGVKIDVVPGSDRGVATSRLVKGKLVPQNHNELEPPDENGEGGDPLYNPHVPNKTTDVYFVISDASDAEFAKEFNATHAPALGFGLKNLNDGVENYPANDGFGYNEKTGQWKFKWHPGHVATGNPAIEGLSGPGGAWGTTQYAPLKVIRWKGRTVVVNAPFISWGDPAKGHQLVVDQFEGQGNGCVPEIRAAMPLQPYAFGLADPENGGPGTGGGPIALADRPVPAGDEISCETDVTENSRYKGGQAVDINLRRRTVSMQAHLAIFDTVNVSYYTVFDTSGLPDAEFMGVIHTPRSAQLGRSSDSAAVGNIEQWANGILWPDGGPDRFQPGIPDYPGGTEGQAYTPMWHITWLFWNCGGDGFEAPSGGQPIDTSDGGPQGGAPAFMRYTFMVNQLTRNCEEDAKRISAERADNNLGILQYGDVDRLVDEGHVLRTNAPPGNFASTLGVSPDPNNPVNTPLPVVPIGNPGSVTNCPVPVTIALDRGAATPGGPARHGASGLHADLDGDGASGAITQDHQTVEYHPTENGSVWNDVDVSLQASVPEDVTEIDMRVRHRADDPGQTRAAVVVETVPVEGGDISIDQALSDVPTALFAGDEVSFSYTVGEEVHVIAAGLLE
jgi:hypothetical protein